jgi:hypothetical protein
MSTPMDETSTNEAAIPNPALAHLFPLVGRWSTVGTHSMVPGTTFHGSTSFRWIEGGAFLVMHSQIDEPDIPSAIAMLGSDGDRDTLFMLYFDERGVSRKFDVTFGGDTLRWWRDQPGFSQRWTGRITDGGQTIVSQSELCRDGHTWERDLQLTYTRID